MDSCIPVATVNSLEEIGFRPGEFAAAVPYQIGNNGTLLRIQINAAIPLIDDLVFLRQYAAVNPFDCLISKTNLLLVTGRVSN